MGKPSKPIYRIYGKRQTEYNTDHQRRCYWGCHAKSEWVWGDWYNLGSVFTQEEAEESVRSWRESNPTHHQYKYNLEDSEFPLLDPYYKSAEFKALGETK